MVLNGYRATWLLGLLAFSTTGHAQNLAEQKNPAQLALEIGAGDSA